MPTLLQIDSCLNMGSTGRITESIGALSISQGWECYIVHGARYANPPSCMHSIPSVSKWGEYLHYLEGLFFDNHGLSSRGATKRVVEIIKEIKPDVIQIHCLHGYYLNYKILFEYLNTTNIPIVWTFHDCWAFTGHCAHFVSVNCDKWKKEGCHGCELKSDYPRALIDYSNRNYNLKKKLFCENQNLHLVAVSYWIEELVKSSFLKDKPIQTIYNGVDVNVFKPCVTNNLRKKYNLNNKKILVAAATAWSQAKGLNDYILLSQKLPDDVVLIMIGLSDTQKKSLPKNVIGFGRTESVNEMATFYSLADIILNLSYAESFGLTTVEGLACGTPGIVYNTTASPELITPETGIVVKSGDVESVAKAVRSLLVKRKPVDICRERAVKYFNKDDRYNEYINLYEHLIKR